MPYLRGRLYIMPLTNPDSEGTPMQQPPPQHKTYNHRLTFQIKIRIIYFVLKVIKISFLHNLF